MAPNPWRTAERTAFLSRSKVYVTEPVLKREHWRGRAQQLALLMQRTEMAAEFRVEILQDLEGTPVLGILHVSPTPLGYRAGSQLVLRLIHGSDISGRLKVTAVLSKVPPGVPNGHMAVGSGRAGANLARPVSYGIPSSQEACNSASKHASRKLVRMQHSDISPKAEADSSGKARRARPFPDAASGLLITGRAVRLPFRKCHR